MDDITRAVCNDDLVLNRPKKHPTFKDHMIMTRAIFRACKRYDPLNFSVSTYHAYIARKIQTIKCASMQSLKIETGQFMHCVPSITLPKNTKITSFKVRFQERVVHGRPTIQTLNIQPSYFPFLEKLTMTNCCPPNINNLLQKIQTLKIFLINGLSMHRVIHVNGHPNLETLSIKRVSGLENVVLRNNPKLRSSTVSCCNKESQESYILKRIIVKNCPSLALSNFYLHTHIEYFCCENSGLTEVNIAKSSEHIQVLIIKNMKRLRRILFNNQAKHLKVVKHLKLVIIESVPELVHMNTLKVLFFPKHLRKRVVSSVYKRLLSWVISFIQLRHEDSSYAKTQDDRVAQEIIALEGIDSPKEPPPPTVHPSLLKSLQKALQNPPKTAAKRKAIPIASKLTQRTKIELQEFDPQLQKDLEEVAELLSPTDTNNTAMRIDEEYTSFANSLTVSQVSKFFLEEVSIHPEKQEVIDIKCL